MLPARAVVVLFRCSSMMSPARPCGTVSPLHYDVTSARRGGAVFPLHRDVTSARRNKSMIVAWVLVAVRAV